ncbi:choline ABC transporter ATP-binding protein [Coralliovum pocilloporae]|uniref:choline ABC transporter ATP-binding protein n=1 Tax=Coralliovum pocilloporae TaxID=3066369 RepID=UPI003306A5BC
MAKPVVQFKDVDIVFGDHPKDALPLMDQGLSREEIQEQTGQILGVHRCSLDVHEGEIVVLMGLSGSGKSTLLRAVNGLNRIVRGEVLVDSGNGMINPSACTSDQLRQLRLSRIGMVFQQFGLLPWRTVEQNVGLGLELAGLSAAKRRDQVMEQLKLVHLDQWANKYVHELSGGMQQRVGLARAFATNAPILLMDEPFSALDPLIRNRLQDELLEFQQKLKRTIVFVSHDLDEALKIGSKIAIMEGGRIVQFGTPQDIVLNPVNEYVSDFVAHMNPLNVLRASELTSPISPASAGVDGIRIDAAGRLVVAADNRILLDGADASLWNLNDGIGDDVDGQGRVACGTAQTPVTDLMKARLATGLPVLIRDGDVITGKVDDADVYGGLLRN